MTDFFDDIKHDIIVREEENHRTPTFLFRVISIYEKYADCPGHDDNTEIVENIVKKRIESIVFRESEIKWFEVKTKVSCVLFEQFENGATYPVVTNIALDATFGSISDILDFITAINIYAKQDYESFISFIPYVYAKFKWNDNHAWNIFKWPSVKNTATQKVCVKTITDFYSTAHNERILSTRKYRMANTLASWCVHLLDRKFENPDICYDCGLNHKKELMKLLEAYDTEIIQEIVEQHDRIMSMYTIHKKMTFPAMMTSPSFGRYSSDPAIFAEEPDSFYKRDTDAIPKSCKKILDDILYDAKSYPRGFMDLLASDMVTKDYDYSDKKVMLTLGAETLYNNASVTVNGFSMRNGICKWNGFDDSAEHMKYPDFISSIVENANQIMSRKNSGKNNWHITDYYPEEKLLTVTFRIGEIFDPARNELYVATISLFGYVHAVTECLKILFKK